MLIAGICNSGLFTFAELFAILYSMVSSSVAEASRSSTLQTAVRGVSGGQRTQRHFSGQLQLQLYCRHLVVINSQIAPFPQGDTLQYKLRELKCQQVTKALYHFQIQLPETLPPIGHLLHHTIVASVPKP